jgi:hypothetical protein
MIMNIFRKMQYTAVAGFVWVASASDLVAGGAQLLTPKQGGASVLAEPNQSAKVLKELKDGESVESGDRKGMYWEVKLADGTKGFVSVVKVKRAAGGSDSGSISDALRSKVKEGRQEDDVANARTRSTVMGVRGLDESGDTAFAGNARPNMRMVYQMEDRQVDPKAIEKLGNQVSTELENKLK